MLIRLMLYLDIATHFRCNKFAVGVVLFSSHHFAHLLSPSLSNMGSSSQEAASSSSGAGSVGQTP